MNKAGPAKIKWTCRNNNNRPAHQFKNTKDFANTFMARTYCVLNICADTICRLLLSENLVLCFFFFFFCFVCKINVKLNKSIGVSYRLISNGDCGKEINNYDWIFVCFFFQTILWVLIVSVKWPSAADFFPIPCYICHFVIRSLLKPFNWILGLASSPTH